jgi:ABC-type lipoprotein release transport system permease subunit
MGAVWYRFRSELRARWKAWFGLALLVGVTGGIVLGALAGARRTDRAYPNFVESQHGYDLMIVNGRPPLFDFATFDLEEIAELPQVTEAAPVNGIPMFGKTPDGTVVSAANSLLLVAPDGRFGRTMNRLHMLEGRTARAPDEIVPTFLAAEKFDLEVGDTIDGGFFNEEQVDFFFDNPGQDFDFSQLQQGRVRVVGIASAPGEFPPLGGGSLSELPVIYFAPSFVDSPLFAPVTEELAVRVRGGTDAVDALKSDLEQRAGGRAAFVRTQDQLTSVATRSMSVQADALRIVALLAALAGALILGQLLARQGRLDDSDRGVLRALGMGPRSLLGVTLARTALIAVAGAVVALLIALALSPLTPVGIAQKAETHPGLAFDPLVLGVGPVLVVLVMLAASIPMIVRVLRGQRAASVDDAAGSLRPSRASEAMARAGMPPTAVSGVRFALVAGRGRTAVPVRATIIGVALGVAAITAVSGFTASLDHLLATPRLFGVAWDAQVGDSFSPNFAVDASRRLAKRDDVAGVGAVTSLQVEVGGRRIGGIGTQTIKGSIGPVTLEGRRPQRANEIALGSQTLRETGYELGDRIKVGVGNRTLRMRIVGRVVVPTVGDLGDLGDIGNSAVMTLRDARRLVPKAAANVMLVRAASPEQRDGLLRHLRKNFEFDGVNVPKAPNDLNSIRKADSMPFVVGGMMLVVAVATIVHGLVTSIRRRRRDLAILKTLGMRRAQISAVVAWQATTVVLIALAIGIPLGVITGNLAWSAFADRLGTVTETAISGLALLVIVPVALLIANAAAAFPARAAARTQASGILRNE